MRVMGENYDSKSKPTLNYSLGKGFTIVELLMVIVIIGILSTLIVVTFNGFQKRANNAQTTDAVRRYVQAILLYAQDNNDYPRTATVATTTSVCLGVGYVSSSCGRKAGDPLCNGIGTATENATYNSKLSPYLGGKFSLPSLQEVMWNSTTSCVGIGYWYAANTYNPSIWYFLSGNVTCPKFSGGTTTSTSNAEYTDCRWMAPAF